MSHLGRSGLLVSPLCLGTINFGSQTGEADSLAIMDRALDEGINFFDSANGYGGGETEQILGRWFSQGGGRREESGPRYEGLRERGRRLAQRFETLGTSYSRCV